MVPIILALAVAGPQAVPEGIHKLVTGPMTMCGITETSAPAFRRKVDEQVAAGKLVAMDGGPRFDLMMTSGDQWPIYQWAFTKAGEAAYPMATCRNVFRDKAGGISQDRQMRCDASRAACDAVFREFADLDKRVVEAMRGK